MAAWQRAGMALYFVTLTSARDGGGSGSIVEHWQALRKRLARHLDVDPCEIQYRGVRTTEGFGVLHLVVAVSPRITGHRWRLVDFENLQAWWREIHGAWHVNIKRISSGGGAARRVSRYVVSQYLVRQGGELVDALVRTFGSRLELRLPELRRQFRSLIWWRRWDTVAGLRDSMTPGDMRRAWWRAWRSAWSDLLERGSVSLWGGSVVLVQMGGVWSVEDV
jgi:hypothetical protein